MITLDPTLHRALGRRAGKWVASPLPRPCEATDYGGLVGGCAVYIACDASDQVLYVGSVHRPDESRGLACRIDEHLSEPPKRLRWRRLWVVTLRPTVSLSFTRDLEGLIGAELDPPWNRRLPRLLPY